MVNLYEYFFTRNVTNQLSIMFDANASIISRDSSSTSGIECKIILRTSPSTFQTSNHFQNDINVTLCYIFSNKRTDGNDFKTLCIFLG